MATISSCFIFSPIRLSARLGSVRKFVLLRHRHSDPQMERLSNDLPESGRRPCYNQISRWEQLRTWPVKEARNGKNCGCVAWTLQKSWQWVLLDRWHSTNGSVFCMGKWRTESCSREMCPHICGLVQTREVEWQGMHFVGRIQSPSCTLSENVDVMTRRPFGLHLVKRPKKTFVCLKRTLSFYIGIYTMP